MTNCVKVMTSISCHFKNSIAKGAKGTNVYSIKSIQEKIGNKMMHVKIPFQKPKICSNTNFSLHFEGNLNKNHASNLLDFSFTISE